MPNDEAPVRAFIGIGSNLGDPVRQVARAFKSLSSMPLTTLRRRSSLYRSAPLGPQDQPHFINAVAELETRLLSEKLLDALQAIENTQGRERSRRWGPRTLDLDLLLYGEQEISTPRLQVPHPGLPQRHFVLYPLAELAPNLQVPGIGPVHGLLSALGDDSIERLDD